MSDEEEGGKPLLEQIKEAETVGYKSPPREGQWKTGQSGNPGGRPKWKPIHEGLLHLVTPEVGEVLASKLIVEAGRGNMTAMNILLDRLEGKVVQAVGGSTDTGPIKLTIEWEK